MEKTKVVILQKRVKEYRVPLFDGIGKLYDTTVVGCQDPLLAGEHYAVLKLKHRYWPVSLDFIWDGALRRLLRQADVIIRPTEFRSVNRLLLKLVAPKAKVVSFGIGVSASYNEHYDETLIDGYFELGATLWKTFPLGGRQRQRNLHLRLDVKNLLDKQYEIVRLYPMPGFSWQFTVGAEI